MRFSVVNLGCKVNRVESDQIASIMLGSGKESSIADADIVFINTCTVTGEADKKTRKAVRHALRENEHCKVVVTGCSSAISPGFYRELSDRVEVIPKGDVLEYAKQLISDASATDANASRANSDFNTRVGIKVQDGCDNACTYCIVHVARGKAKSEPVDQIAAECAAFARQGVKEMVLTGINLGSYAYSDSYGSYALHDLLERLLDETAIAPEDGLPCRFRLSSIEPDDLTDQVIELMAESDGRICRHLHLPLQSGSTKVLREMARRYDAGYYASLVRELRERIPQISISTDIIVGFPGETEEDFQLTMQMARECGFSKIHVFPYSKREGTPAAAREDQIPDDVKSERARRLRRLSDELREADYRSRIGTAEKAVVIRSGICMTESYYEIPCSQNIPIGSLVDVVIE